MKVKFVDTFSCYYRGEKLSFKEGDETEGWPAERGLAKGKAVPFTDIEKEQVDESQSDAP